MLINTLHIHECFVHWSTDKYEQKVEYILCSIGLGLCQSCLTKDRANHSMFALPTTN